MYVYRVKGSIKPRGWAFAALVLFVSACGGTKTVADSEPKIDPANLITYEKHIAPIMVAHCTPCHYPEKGKKEMLDTYEKVAEFSGAILRRVQLPVEDDYFMPYKSKKPALSAEQIDLIKTWVAQKKPK